MELKMNIRKILLGVIPIITIVLISVLSIASSSDVKTEYITSLAKVIEHYVPNDWDALISPRVNPATVINQEETKTWQVILKHRLFCAGLDVTYKNNEVIIQRFQTEKPIITSGFCKKDYHGQNDTIIEPQIYKFETIVRSTAI